MGLSPFRCDPLNRDVPSCNSGSWSLSSSSILAKIFLELRVGPLVIAGVGVRLRQRLRIVRGHLVLEEPAACNRPEVLDQVERIAVPRTEVVPLTNFIGAIIQAEQLGVSISKVLQVQSEQLRIERRQRAEEMAAKAPIKMLFPLVGCIFPSLFIIILGPAIILIMQNLKA